MYALMKIHVYVEAEYFSRHIVSNAVKFKRKELVFEKPVENLPRVFATAVNVYSFPT